MAKRIPPKNKGGDCYEVAANYVLDHAFIVGKDQHLTLVHGVVTGQGPIEGIQYGHAWVEDGGTVIDLSNGRDIRFPKALYYSLGDCKPKFVYTPEQVREKVLSIGHYGPWDYNPPL